MKRTENNKGKMPKFRQRLMQLQGDMSITDFANHVGLSRQTMGFYINGDRIPDIETLKRICEKCSVSADWLLGIIDIKSQEHDVRRIAEYTGLSEDNICYLYACSHITSDSKDIPNVHKDSVEKIIEHSRGLEDPKILGNQITDFVNRLIAASSDSPYMFGNMFKRYIEANRQHIRRKAEDDRILLDKDIPENIKDIASNAGYVVLSAGKASKWYVSELFRFLEQRFSKHAWDEEWAALEKKENLDGTYRTD